jgi:DNA polymerase-3 subunit gamma/tau
MVHAQRLLPLEELLSGQAAQAASSGGAKAAAAPVRAPSAPVRGSVPSQAAEPDSRAPAAPPFARPSPFEADRNRKSEPKAEARMEPAGAIPRASANPPFMGEAAASEESPSGNTAVATAVAVQLETSGEPAPDNLDANTVRNAVLTALEEAGQNMLAHNLEEAEWSVVGLEVSAKVAMSQVLIDIALGPEPKRVIQAALNGVASTPLKFKMVSGGAATVSNAPSNAARRPANGTGARSRAMNDPVVQRMQEKFGAEIRTVIDQKDRG